MLFWYVFALLSAYGQGFTYCIDKRAEAIFTPRIEKCLGKLDDGRMAKELDYVRGISTSEYQRSHELFAWNFFVEQRKTNRFYAGNCDRDSVQRTSVNFEYIPILPLVWRGGLNSYTDCTAGGQDCGYDIDKCSWKILVKNIIEYQTKVVDMRSNTTHPQRFFVASTFNFRSILGMGMPTQVRRGSDWESVSRFTKGVMLASYERISQSRPSEKTIQTYCRATLCATSN